MSDIQVTPEMENAFEAPKADLSNNVSEKPVLELTRFSTWAVFFLSMFTMGIYAIYWMFTRVNRINTVSKKAKANIMALYVYIAANVGSNIALYAFTSVNTSLLLTLVSMVSFYITVYTMRSALIEIINEGSKEQVKIGPIKTFFFTIFYIQYKTNEAIDKQAS